MKKIYISVIGAGECSEEIEKIAYQTGKLIAERGAILICGGLGGVMNAAAQGANDSGGLVIGVLPSSNRAGESKYLSASVSTGMGNARNALVVQSGDVVIAISGGHGTLSEIGLALKTGKPVVGIKTWELEKIGLSEVIKAKTPEEAVEKAFELVEDRKL
jgi:uncharacterized protein (TIGR00725 family)